MPFAITNNSIVNFNQHIKSQMNMKTKELNNIFLDYKDKLIIFKIRL